MAEYQQDDGNWVCSSHGVWLPGVYDSQKACRVAYRVDPLVLHRIWEGKRGTNGIVPNGEVISLEELRAALKMEGQSDG